MSVIVHYSRNTLGVLRVVLQALKGPFLGREFAGGPVQLLVFSALGSVGPGACQESILLCLQSEAARASIEVPTRAASMSHWKLSVSAASHVLTAQFVCQCTSHFQPVDGTCVMLHFPLGPGSCVRGLDCD